MKRNIDLQKEWDAIGAGFDLHTPLPSFKIPNNYFSQFPEQMLEIVAPVAERHLNFTTENPYTLPNSYFESFADTMLLQARAFDDIVGQTSIQSLNKVNPYTVPTGYFDGLTDEILSKVFGESDIDSELEDSPLLSALKGSNPFNAPKIDIPIPKTMTPPEPIEEPVELAPIRLRKSFRNVTWAAAAAVILFFTVGGAYLQVNSNHSAQPVALQSSVKNDTKALLADVTNKDIEQYVALHSDEFDELTIENSLQDDFSKEQAPVEKSAKEILQEVSKQDIEEYLKTHQ